MTPETPHRPRILCVGAYERDNFGDLLFQMVSDRYFTGMDVVYAAPFASDMSELTGHHVPAFGPLLTTETFDAVWTVGGEVGGTTNEYAYMTAFGWPAVRALEASPADQRRAQLAELQGPIPVESPYLPRASAYPGSLGAATVLNSVGLSRIAELAPIRKAGLLGILREATRISVRDRLSSAFLESEDIAHTLDPDLVHALAVSRPRPDLVRGDYVLVQVSEPHLKKVSVEAFAQALIDGPVFRDNPVRLFLAGTAPGHDSVEAYQRIVELVLAADPERRITISQMRDPWDRVDEIAAAKLWVGGSLHGRIVACAYGVPRVSIAKRKLDEYAQTWDDAMPWGVEPPTMAEAAETALAVTGDDRGETLGRQAHDNMTAAVAHVRAWADFGAPAGRAEELFQLRNRQWDRLMIEEGRADDLRQEQQRRREREEAERAERAQAERERAAQVRAERDRLAAREARRPSRRARRWVRRTVSRMRRPGRPS
ncbi:polysaccharide pyruvyl transferase family protein [Microbacterium sp.]|uniref:polysaccharide pyruvyl transferase family protein n=1 Tax=Microbacterium sp. TaxID=51671 RepID=UPI003A8C7B57